MNILKINKTMNDRMNFDTDICLASDHEPLQFSFSIENAVAPPSLSISIQDKETKNEKAKYKVVTYLYGRIHIGKESFFAEVVGYIHQANPEIVTYHIVTVDPNFYKRFTIDYSNSDIYESDFISFL